MPTSDLGDTIGINIYKKEDANNVLCLPKNKKIRLRQLCHYYNIGLLSVIADILRSCEFEIISPILSIAFIITRDCLDSSFSPIF